MKALVAGGAGFVGSHLCDRLLADGWSVVCLDNYATSSPSNVAHLLGHSRFTLLQRDLTAGPLEDELAADRYFHLALAYQLAKNARACANALREARKLGLPAWKIAKMLKNVAVEAAGGAIPVLGNLFDVAFKANLRNLAIIEEHFGIRSSAPTLDLRPN